MISKMLAEFVSNTAYEDIPAGALHAARRCLLDWLGCAIGGSRARSSSAFSSALAGERGLPECTIVGAGHRTSLLAASMINAAFAHALELDDLHRGSIYHPGAPVVSAALAVAEKEDARLSDLLRAIVLGYETSIRVGECVTPSHYRYWHTTGTVGAFGSAVAAAVLLGLDRDQIVWALGNAGTQAAGLWEFIRDGSMSKTLHCAKAACNGVLAAALAREGFTGPASIFEGDQGFCRAMAEEFDLAKITEELGLAYRIQDIAFKVHASCGHTHSAIDAVLAMRQSGRIGLDTVEKLTVHTYPTAIKVAGDPCPRDGYAAKFSIAYCVAVALKHGDVGLGRFDQAVLDDSDIQRIMGLTELVVDDRLAAMYPRRFPARVVAQTTGGDRVNWEVMTPRGEPPEDLTDNELAAKFAGVAGEVIGKDHARRACREILTGDPSMPVRKLTEQL